MRGCVTLCMPVIVVAYALGFLVRAAYEAFRGGISDARQSLN
jgi:hypothetical protein